MSMTREDAADFGRRSAESALDAFADYGSVADSIAAHYDNVRCTLEEHGASMYEDDAYAAFDAVVAASK